MSYHQLPERPLIPEDVKPDIAIYKHSIQSWDDLEAVDQADFLNDYVTANPDLYFEAITDSVDGEEFVCDLMNLYKTLHLMRLDHLLDCAELEDEVKLNKSHLKCLIGFRKTMNMFSDYIGDDIQEDILNRVDSDAYGFPEKLSHHYIVNLRMQNIRKRFIKKAL